MDIVLENLMEKYPNYDSNELTRKNMENEFKKIIDSISKMDFYSDIPLKILSIQKNPHGKGAIVQFYTDNATHMYGESDHYSDFLKFDYIALMDEEKAGTLDENQKYFISCKKMDQLNETETYIIVSRTYFAPETKIEKSSSGDKYQFYAGVCLCEVNTIISTNEQLYK